MIEMRYLFDFGVSRWSIGEGDFGYHACKVAYHHNIYRSVIREYHSSYVCAHLLVIDQETG
jgi:hypothetical protein